MSVHRRFIHISPKSKTTGRSINKVINKQVVVWHTILHFFFLKQMTDTCNKVDEWGEKTTLLSEESQTKRIHMVWFHF